MRTLIFCSFCTLLALLLNNLCSGVIIKHDLYTVSKATKGPNSKTAQTPGQEYLGEIRKFAEKISTASKAFQHESKAKEKQEVEKAGLDFLRELYQASSTLYGYGTADQFLIKVNVGSPPQSFYVAPTFFSADFWLVDEECESKVCRGAIRQRNRFRKLKSTSYFQNDEQVETFGYIGEIASDKLSVSDGVSVNQTFALAYEMNPQYNDFVADGEFGLLVNPIMARIQSAKTPLQNLGGVLDDQVFTLAVDASSASKLPADSPTPIGQLTFGSLDAEHCSGWRFADISPSDPYAAQYLFRLSGYRVGNVNNHRRKYAMVVPGLPVALAPTVAVTWIAQLIGATYNEEQYFYTISCDANANGNLPDIELKVADSTLNIRPEKYIVDASALGINLPKNQCLFGLIPFDLFFMPAPSWYIGGDLILADHCIAYDFGRGKIGFGQKKSQK